MCEMSFLIMYVFLPYSAYSMNPVMNTLFYLSAGGTGLFGLCRLCFCYAGSGAGCCAGTATGRYSTATP